MSKNPIINALGASAYIILIVTLMNFIMKTQSHKPDTIFAPMTVLSLLTLSAAVMIYVFFYQPLQFLIDGKKKEALNLFVKTIGVFAAFTGVVLILLFSGVLK
jgi:hypothetical protein